MANAWDQAKEEAKNAPSGLFVKLSNDGDKMVFAVSSDPAVRKQVWEEKKQSYRPYTAADEKEGVAYAPKFSINVFVFADKTNKIWEMNKTIFESLAAVIDKFNKDEWSFEVVRTGKDNKKAKYTILPEKKLTDDQIKAIKMAKVHDLTRKRDDDDEDTDLESHKKSEKAESKSESKPASAPSAPSVHDLISEAKALEIVNRMKAGKTKEQVDEMRSKFSFKKVSELPASKVAAVEAHLDALEGKTSAPADDDDFA